jgi:tRNA-dihydrouridine synthase 2
MLRLATSIMTASSKRVPIPRNGVDYRGKLVLAPMVRSGELPSRLLALHYGADLVWGPETVDRALIGTTRAFNTGLSTVDFTRFSNNGSHGPRKDQKESVIFRLHPEREGKKLIFQLGTSDPDRAVAAAKLVAGDVAGIDVNAGCPKPFSTSGGMGAALLRTPDKLCSILEALVKNVASEFEIGISVKIRLLETPEETEALIRRLCATGITGLTVHCRTTPMRPREKAIREQLKMVADVCREAGVACLMNGDVASRDHAQDLVTEFGVDGAMIATAAETNPSCFRRKEDGGLAPWREVVELYLMTCMEMENRWGNTKYLLGHLIPGKDPAYQGTTQSKCYTGICELLGFPRLIERAKEVDHVLGMDEEPKQGKKKQNSTAMAAGGNSQKKDRKPLSTRGVENSKPSVESSKPAVQNPMPIMDIAQPIIESAPPVQL